MVPGCPITTSGMTENEQLIIDETLVKMKKRCIGVIFLTVAGNVPSFPSSKSFFDTSIPDDIE
jgi:hypothetical protein